MVLKIKDLNFKVEKSTLKKLYHIHIQLLQLCTARTARYDPIIRPSSDGSVKFTTLVVTNEKLKKKSVNFLLLKPIKFRLTPLIKTGLPATIDVQLQFLCDPVENVH